MSSKSGSLTVFPKYNCLREFWIHFGGDGDRTCRPGIHKLLDVNNICKYYRALNVVQYKWNNYLIFKLMYLLWRRGFLLTLIFQKGGEKNLAISLTSGIAGSYCGRAYGEYKLLIYNMRLSKHPPTHKNPSPIMLYLHYSPE